MNKDPKSIDNTLETVLKKFRASRSYTRKGFWTTWNSCWKLYNNERVSIGYDGSTERFIPETFTIVQAVKAHVLGGNLHIKFLPRKPEQTGDTQVLNNLFQYAWDKDFMDQKLDPTIEETLVAGNAYLFTFVGEGGFPTTQYVSAKDSFFDDQAKNYYELRYCGFRYMTTVSDLKDETIANPDYNEQDKKSKIRVPRYMNLKNLEGGWKNYGNDKTAKQEREEMTAGSILSESKDVVEVIVYIDKERMVRIANRTTVIEDVETPFKRASKIIQSVDDAGNPVEFELPEIKPFLPVAPFRDYIDGNMFYAKGEIEKIGESQEYLNDVATEKADNLAFVLKKMFSLDPAYASKIDEIQSMPGAVFTVPPGALQEINITPIGSDADTEIMRTKQEMRGATSADEIIQGQSVKGDATAYEVRQTIAQAGTRFALKLRTLENEGLRILSENMWKIMQIYITKETPIRTNGNDGSSFNDYNPGLYLGEWDVQVMLDSSAQAIKETEKQMAMQFFLLASKVPFVDQMKLFIETTVSLFDKTEEQAKEFILPPQEVQQVADEGAQQDMSKENIQPAGTQATNTPGVPSV